jgi:enamine deaminase RidA (YjgF/YER057c/UK114 family)
MYLLRTCLAVTILTVFGAGALSGQKKKSGSDDDGYIPQVLPEKQKKLKDQQTQTLAAPRELPLAIEADTDRLAFEVSPLSAKGLLSQQTRDALKNLLKSNRGTIVKLRAFVAGSGDLRRVGELTAEAFSEKHQPLPVLTVVQAGGLPLAGAQVVIEATEVDKKPVNPNGLAFVSGQSGAGMAQSVDRLNTVLRGAGMDAADAVRVTCFVSSLDDEKNARTLLTRNFPNAVVNYAQMQREPVTPAAECEAVARLRTAPAESVRFLNPGSEASSNYSQIALVTSPKLVITGTQLAFGSHDADFSLAFERLEKALNSVNASYAGVVMSHMYLTSTDLIKEVRSVRAHYYNDKRPPASTTLPFEGLPSLDAQMGLDVIAVGDVSSAQR